MKGITPIISIIILLLITVALAGTAWMYLSQFMGTYTEKSFMLITGNNPRCVSGDNGNITIYIKNTGTTAITASDWVTATIDGTQINGIPASIPSGSTGILYNTGTYTSGMQYTIVLGTEARITERTVTCP